MIAACVVAGYVAAGDSFKGVCFGQRAADLTCQAESLLIGVKRPLLLPGEGEQGARTVQCFRFPCVSPTSANNARDRARRSVAAVKVLNSVCTRPRSCRAFAPLWRLPRVRNSLRDCSASSLAPA